MPCHFSLNRQAWLPLGPEVLAVIVRPKPLLPGACRNLGHAPFPGDWGTGPFHATHRHNTPPPQRSPPTSLPPSPGTDPSAPGPGPPSLRPSPSLPAPPPPLHALCSPLRTQHFHRKADFIIEASVQTIVQGATCKTHLHEVSQGRTGGPRAQHPSCR